MRAWTRVLVVALCGLLPSADSARAAPDATRIERASRTLAFQDLMRIEGSFGTFYGRSPSITPRGLTGLVPEPGREGSPPRESALDWSEIDRISVRRRSALRGALIGATLSGGAWLIGRAAARNTAEYVDYGGVTFVGATLSGTGIGALLHHWKVVYRR